MSSEPIEPVEQPKPDDVTLTTICSQCKYQEQTKFLVCPKCDSRNVHTTTVSHFNGYMTTAHIVDSSNYVDPHRQGGPSAISR